MTELDTAPRRESAAGTSKAPTSARSLRRRGGLPSGRAVVGGFLIAVAAVGTFGAYTQATAPPRTAYLVATADVQQGSTVQERHLGRIAVHLPEPLASTTYRRPDDVVGTVALAPIRAGQLIQQGMLAERVTDGLQEVSLSLPADRVFADGNPLRVGERIDLLATYTDGPEAFTTEIVRGALVLTVGGSGGDGLAERGRRSITVGLADETQVMALTHALAVAEVAVARVTGQASDADPPRTFRPLTPDRP
ncbi:MAG TPA: SAF domain-containing protein [Egibacteraceae bacterium]|nr:SAF domain-containing protein [Egibacteraceae bacterium]